MSDSILQDQIYQTGAEFAERKEAAIKKALAHYYKTPIWDEDEIADRGVITYHATGQEIFSMGDVDLVLFMPPTTNIEIEANRVTCTLHQGIMELYCDE